MNEDLKNLKKEIKNIDVEVFGKKKSLFWLKLLHPDQYYRQLRLVRAKNKQHYYNATYYWTHKEQENARCKKYYAEKGV